MTPGTARAFASDRLRAFVEDAWASRIVPTLEEYVRIPAKSPGFDREWQAHGHLDRAVELAARWARERPWRVCRSKSSACPDGRRSF